ncbi:MAG: ABC transporter permease subunit [Alphaproteobacteria bacterium]|nr:ABC transporter permease subunit [Alphaproteobacteria bacterium]
MNSLRLALIAAVLLGLWQGIVVLFALPPFILPGPLAVARAAADNAALLTWHSIITLGEIAAGTFLGVALGAATALAMAASKPLRGLLAPLLLFSQIIPVFAVAPLLTLWLGYGFGPKVVMAVLVIFFPVASAFFDGLMQTRREWLDLAANAAATPARSLLLLRVPAAIPSFVTGLRLALIYAPIGAVLGEWVGASRGLGYLMLFANGRAHTDLMFAALLALTLLAMLFYAVIMALAKMLLGKYLRA